MTLTTYQFDNLDHLMTLDADTRTIARDDLATTLGISLEAVQLRMRRLEAEGFVDITRPGRESPEPITYRISARGVQAYRAHLLRMDGVTGPPPLHASIETATLTMMALHAYGTECAA